MTWVSAQVFSVWCAEGCRSPGTGFEGLVYITSLETAPLVSVMWFWGNKQIIRTHFPREKSGSDYIALVPVTGIEPVRFLQRGILSCFPAAEDNGICIRVKGCKNLNSTGIIGEKLVIWPEIVRKHEFALEEQKRRFDRIFCTAAVTARYFSDSYTKFIGSTRLSH